MTDLLILCEKKSAYDKFVETFHGAQGTFEGSSYKLTHAQGHLLTLKAPDKQTNDEEKAARYAAWDKMDYFPWELKDFSWRKTPITLYDRKTHKKNGSTARVLKKIKADGQNCKALVIGTDIDPSGEGDLLAWEIINAIGWKKPVYRMRPSSDTSGEPLRKALRERDDVTDQRKQGEYVKAVARERFDFASMQLTRIATFAARKSKVQPVMRIGRLKSVVLSLIYQQWEAIRNYKKRPYFEIQYRDQAGHIFKRTFEKGKSTFRFALKDDAERERKKYGPDMVTNIQKKLLKQSPGLLLDLSDLGGLLAKQGIPASTVESVYQSLYEAEYVSYPRTQDTKITQEQFDELLPIADDIAKVVGVDTKLLTHRALRPKHKVASADHGPNRPNRKVPASLEELDHKFGPTASKIYKLVALSFLSILGEDYEYNHITANLEKHPDFKTSVNVPVAANYRLIFDDQADEKKEPVVKGPLGPKAIPLLHEGVNSKPSKPTQKMIADHLKKLNVGTGATRQHVFVELTLAGRELKAGSTGVLALSPVGSVNAALIQGTWISDPKITAQLFKMMEAVTNFKASVAQVLNVLTKIVIHDKPIILAHGDNLSSEMADGALEKAQALNNKGHKTKKSKKFHKTTAADYVQAKFKGKSVKFKRIWGGASFTDEELVQLLVGKQIIIERTGPKGVYKVKGHLDDFEFKGHKYFGFVKDEFVNK